VKKRKVVKAEQVVELDQGTYIKPDNEWIARNIRQMPGYTPVYLTAARTEQKKQNCAKSLMVA
jgi:hypothetical protein